MRGIPLGDTVYFDAVTHSPSTGGVADGDSTPTYDVFENATDTPILSAQPMTKRTSKTGDYRGSFTASTGNGFEIGKWYNIVVVGIVGGITGKKVAQTFRVDAAEATPGTPKVDIDLGPIADSIPATGVVPSISQAIYMLFLRHFFTTVPGTPNSTVTQTVKKVNGSTTSFTATVTLDASGNVISVVRAT